MQTFLLQNNPLNMSVSVSKAQDYSPKEISAGTYILRAVNPENGQPTISLSSTYNTDFLLPNTVLNLGRSYLNFAVTFPAQLAYALNAVHNGFLAPIDGIVLSTASGVRLVDMNNLPEFTKLTWRSMTNFEDFQSFPVHTSAAGFDCTIADAAHAAYSNVSECAEAGHLFHRTRVTADGATASASFAAGAVCFTGEDRKTLDNIDDAYTGVSNALAPFIATSSATLANIPQMAYRVQLPLKMIYGSLLELDKDLYLGEQVRLTIRWNLGSKIGYAVPGASYVAATTAATGLCPPVLATTDATVLPTISNVQLRIAVETNDAIASAIKQKVMADSGIQIRIPYTYVFKGVTSGVANDTVTIIRKLNRGHGAKLVRVVAGVFAAAHSANSGGSYCNTYNYALGAAGVAPIFPKWQSYRTFIDSKPLTDDILTLSDYFAYEYNKEKFRGSCIRSLRDFLQNPAIIEDFSGVPYAKDWPETDDIASGLDLSTEREFALQVTAGSSATIQPIYVFAITQKGLSITREGISLM